MQAIPSNGNPHQGSFGDHARPMIREQPDHDNRQETGPFYP